MTTIVIGLDGANWPLLREWLDEGRLPNLQRLIDDGIGGTSRSCLPPLTVPNWKCYATGKNPGKLDVFRFDRIDTDEREHVFHDATDFRSAELWDYVEDEGLRAGVVNVPSTYPPKEMDGFMVAGGPDASDSEYRSLQSGYATPADVERYLDEELDYSVHPTPMISPSDTGEDEVDAILELIDMRFEAAEQLLDREQPDFLHLTVFYSMALQHYFWRDAPVERAWRRIDENLTRFTEQDHDILVMSDHGTQRVDTVFYINRWLAEEGYLSLGTTVDQLFRRVGVTRERALTVAKKLGMVDTLSKVVPESVQKVVPWEEGVKRDRVLSAVNWERTTAVASNQGPIYLTLSKKDPRYETVRQELVEKLTGLTHPETGAPLVEAVHRGEEHYEGPYAENAPDLILDQGPNVHTSDAVGAGLWYADEGVWRGGNESSGLFLFSGPSFRAEGLTLDARIVDLAPTLLHTMGMTVPADMDGRVLDVFDPESVPGKTPVRTREPLPEDHEGGGGDSAGVERRLADLGYLE
ncbi:alkaline phosphatase family protein [Haloarchaeobius baliensis]|uniref:alkaline phosphatase family protein n=1 Tax=Haloarchaeobius baliensis TaxID=1670458 RepID=UPI003F881F68